MNINKTNIFFLKNEEIKKSIERLEEKEKQLRDKEKQLRDMAIKLQEEKLLLMRGAAESNKGIQFTFFFYIFTIFCASKTMHVLKFI
jgi:hypothetical protein